MSEKFLSSFGRVVILASFVMSSSGGAAVAGGADFASLGPRASCPHSGVASGFQQDPMPLLLAQDTSMDQLPDRLPPSREEHMRRVRERMGQPAQPSAGGTQRPGSSSGLTTIVRPTGGTGIDLEMRHGGQTTQIRYPKLPDGSRITQVRNLQDFRYKVWDTPRPAVLIIDTFNCSFNTLPWAEAFLRANPDVVGYRVNSLQIDRLSEFTGMKKPPAVMFIQPKMQGTLMREGEMTKAQFDDLMARGMQKYRILKK